ncbi:aldose 1-epimerase family protein [Selenomonas sp. AE3005]|uniref:aldose 1-epimerase family protein n=1 Tax=Selenomonas sp. AE3005 TaxID=1485543 RepID=UPI0025F29622|nr:aldose 1-epimerase family protein [Selenomonas sp. AE3005]
MLYSLENDKLCVQVRSYGAELRSIKERADETEYLWDGNPQWWKYSSPVLFPIVGKLQDGKYRVNGNEFELPGHGFGRISEYQLVERRQDYIEFALKWSEESLASYPWKFQLNVAYALKDKTVEVIWKVQNLDDKEMVYSIGAHTAFRCPLVQGEEFSDYYLKFNQEEDNINMPLNSKGQFLKAQGETHLQGQQLDLNYEMFAGDALAYEGLKSDVVSICSHKSDKKVSMEAKDFPFWGFWTPAQGGAPFLCLEPWQGHADYEGYDGEFAEREGSLKLASGETQKFHYTIRIG